jgi:hypothetical protein
MRLFRSLLFILLLNVTFNGPKLDICRQTDARYLDCRLLGYDTVSLDYLLVAEVQEEPKFSGQTF